MCCHVLLCHVLLCTALLCTALYCSVLPCSGRHQHATGLGVRPALVYVVLQPNVSHRTAPDSAHCTVLPRPSRTACCTAPYCPDPHVRPAVLHRTAQTLTDPTYGLLYSPPALWYGWTLNRADVTLNAWAAGVVGLASLPPPLVSGWWLGLVVGRQVSLPSSSSPPYTYGDLSSLAWVR